jgi:hypothetical protein
LGSLQLAATKVANDNNRLRRALLEQEDQYKDQKIAELEFLLHQYKHKGARSTAAGCHLSRATDVLGVTDGTDSAASYGLLDGLTNAPAPTDGNNSADTATDELESAKARENSLAHRLQHLEDEVNLRNNEIRHLQDLVGRTLTSNSNPSTRLIYLEEHTRNLEQVTALAHGNHLT